VAFFILAVLKFLYKNIMNRIIKNLVLHLNLYLIIYSLYVILVTTFDRLGTAKSVDLIGESYFKKTDSSYVNGVQYLLEPAFYKGAIIVSLIVYVIIIVLLRKFFKENSN